MKPLQRTIRWTCTLSAALIATSALAACGAGNTSAPADKAGSKDNAAQSNTPTKITMMINLKNPETPSDTVEKFVEEKTNTQLEIQWVPDGSYDEKFQAALATGSLPMISYLKNAASFINLRSALKSGQFWEIGPYLKDYPNLSKLNPEVLKNTTVDGKIYTLYQELPMARQGVMYRKDWADKLGIPEPKTTDDLYNMLKKFKEADLGGAGKTVPLADRNDLVYGSFKTLSSYFGTPNNWGVENGQLVPEFKTKGYMDTMNFIKKLHKEGLINQDFPVTSKTDQQNMMFTGRAGMYIGSLQDAEPQLMRKTLPNVKDAQYEVVNKIIGPTGKPATWAVPGYGTVLVFPKSAVKSEAELKKLLAFADKLFDKDIANALYYGLEGPNYTLKDGKVVPVADAKVLAKDVSPYQGMTLARITNILPQSYQYPVGEKAEQLIKEAESFALQDPTNPLDSKTYNEKGAKLQDIIKDATYKYILGNIDEKGFQDAVKKWEEQGGAKIIEEFNASYKASGGK
ncbi:extracellular solute-binding protein [Paenibacillus chartarius]|uniref:Extracellular solute-binding protein n=1 Tax=Paenibacillus chartarius TaxID=747481 RepID=A0ABV6DPZ5_9BACL